MDDDDCHLVAGLHRLTAMRNLGMETCDAFVVDMDSDARLLWEIDENLCRAELTPAQQADHLMRRKEVWERVKESGTNSPTLTGRGNTAFASETAAATGKDKREINRAVSRAEKIAPDVLAEEKPPTEAEGLAGFARWIVPDYAASADLYRSRHDVATSPMDSISCCRENSKMQYSANSVISRDLSSSMTASQTSMTGTRII